MLTRHAPLSPPFPFSRLAVNTLVEIDNMLWVGGVFSRSFDPVTGASQTLRGLAVWNGTDFISPFPQLGNGVVNVITPAYSGGKTYVFVGGTFTTAGNIVCNRICMWDGERWHALGLGVSDTVRAIEVAGVRIAHPKKMFDTLSELTCFFFWCRSRMSLWRAISSLPVAFASNALRAGITVKVLGRRLRRRISMAGLRRRPTPKSRRW